MTSEEESGQCILSLRERKRVSRSETPTLSHRNPHIRYSPIAISKNVAFSHPFHLHFTGGGLWLSANFATCEPALAAANCPRSLAVIESTDVPQKYGDTIMKRTSLIVAILTLCLKQCWLLLLQLATPPACSAVAACTPPPPPVCNPCATAPVTYGAPVAPVAPYAPPPQW